MNELSAAVIGAVVGAVFAYIGGWLQHVRDRRRRRTSLATVLLAELWSAEATLRQVYESPFGLLPTRAFDLLRSPNESLDLFHPSTVTGLLQFGGNLNSIQDLLDAIANGRVQQSQLSNAYLMVNASAGVHLVPALKRALEKEGGKYVALERPELPAMASRETTPPPLPPSAFGTRGASLKA